MIKIRNTGIPNVFGTGNEKEIELDNGKKYILRNTGIPNVFGDGYEQEIEEIHSNPLSGYSGAMTLKDRLVLIFVGIPIGLFGLSLILGAVWGIASCIYYIITA